MNLLFWIALQYSPPVVPPTPAPAVDVASYGGGGTWSSRGVSGGGVSRARLRQWERSLTASLKAKPVTKEAAKETQKVKVEAALRSLNLPLPVEQEIIEVWKEGKLPSLRAIASATGTQTASDYGVVTVETGNATNTVPAEPSYSSYGTAYGDAVQNPTDEELMEMLVG